MEEQGIEVEVVPGIPSFCAVADALKLPLMAWNEDLVVAPVRKNSSSDLGRILREHDNVILMNAVRGIRKPALAGIEGKPVWKDHLC